MAIAMLGIDEAGRGSWAGPLVVAAVILKKSIPGLRDSKKLSKIQREKIADLIINSASAVSVGMSEADQIDELGLTEAERVAIEASLFGIEVPYSEIIIDGKYNFLSYNLKSRAVVSADSLVDCVSAASVIAKVIRDQIMVENSIIYPGYGFERHVGYGTKLHRDQLAKLGVSKIHRLSYKPVGLAIQKIV